MSSHPFGSQAIADGAQIADFVEAISEYALARLKVKTYEVARDELPEAFTMNDMAELNARRVAQCKAADVVLGLALVLKGGDVLSRCINALGDRL